MQYKHYLQHLNEGGGCIFIMKALENEIAEHYAMYTIILILSNRFTLILQSNSLKESVHWIYK